MSVDDESLALAAAAGDGQAFAALLERQYDRVFGLCFRLTGDRAEAEDLTQDICAALPAKLSGFRGQARLTTWLYRVVVNAAHDRRRRNASHARAARGWGDWEMARQAVIAEGQDQAAWLAQAMGALPEDLRDTLVLVLDGLSHAEAGDVLGVSEGTVSWRMAEVKKRLRRLHAAQEGLA